MVWITGPSNLMLMRKGRSQEHLSFGAKILALKRAGKFSDSDMDLFQSILRDPHSAQSAKDRKKLKQRVQKQWEKLGLNR